MEVAGSMPCPVLSCNRAVGPIGAIFFLVRCLHISSSLWFSREADYALRIENRRTVLGGSSQWRSLSQISVRVPEQYLYQVANQESFLINCASFHCRAYPHWAFIITVGASVSCLFVDESHCQKSNTLSSPQDLLCNGNQDMDFRLASCNPAIIFRYCFSSQLNQMVFECHSGVSNYLLQVTDVFLMVLSSWFPDWSLKTVFKILFLPWVKLLYCRYFTARCGVSLGSTMFLGMGETSIDFAGVTNISKVNYMYK